MKRYYLFLDGKIIGKKVKCERPLTAGMKIFKRIMTKTGIKECEFDIVEKRSKKIYTYFGQAVKLKYPIQKTIGQNTFYILNKYHIKRIKNLQ